MKCTCVSNNLNQGSVPFSCFRSRPWHCACMALWAIINHRCAFPATTGYQVWYGYSAFLMVPREEHALTPARSHFWQPLNYASQWVERVSTPKSTLHLHLFSTEMAAFRGELTDWNEPDLSCVIIRHLAVAHTSSNYFRQRVLYLNCAPLEDFAFISTEFSMLCTLEQQAICAVPSLNKNQ